MSSSQFKFPPVDELPEQAGLPDPFIGPDGKRIRSLDDWPAQREYLKAMLSHYMYGHMPPRPATESVTIKQIMSRPAFEGEAIEEHFLLTIDREGKKVDLDIWLFRPSIDQRYPTIIKNCGALFDVETGYGKWPEDGQASSTVQKGIADDTQAAREAVKRGYLLCKFNREQLAIDIVTRIRHEQAGIGQPNHRDVGIYPLFPEYDWGAMAVWAWGHSVVLDALDRLGYADTAKTVATGHSRGGQTAMAAGIYDERIAIVAPNTGGYGSCGTVRIRDPQGVRGEGDMVELITSASPHWHTMTFHDFSGQQNKLPFDGHTLVSLIAPRPFLNVNATEDAFNNTLAIEAGIRTGRVVYDWMERSDWCRVHWRPGTHAQQKEDWWALFDYSDEYFFGKKGNSLFNQWVYSDFTPPLSWEVPIT